jgi:hypothetical protein
VGVSPATLTGVVRRFRLGALKSLMVRPGRGRKPSIAPQKVSEILRATWHEKPPGYTPEAPVDSQMWSGGLSAPAGAGGRAVHGRPLTKSRPKSR